MDTCRLMALLENCHAESYAWALCCCSRNAAQAEEVLQRVYLSALEEKARYDGRASFKTWLFAIIRRTAADERRRDWLRHLRLLRYTLGAEAVGTAEPPDQSMGRSELQATFARALAALPLRQGQVLHLVFYQDFSLSEAAQAMGISLGSTRTHYERAKATLRRRLKDTMLDETGHRGNEAPGAVRRDEAGR
jgi:RNA polymerase sigma-70 factor (ECF subfamily)